MSKQECRTVGELPSNELNGKIALSPRSRAGERAMFYRIIEHNNEYAEFYKVEDLSLPPSYGAISGKNHNITTRLMSECHHDLLIPAQELFERMKAGSFDTRFIHMHGLGITREQMYPSKILTNPSEVAEAKNYFEVCRTQALESTCQRRRCGSVIVNNDEIIGRGYNSPPRHLGSQKRCMCDKKNLHEKVSDKTCCAHAERRAMDEALRTNSEKIEGARIYFASIDRADKLEFAGEPYCTRCSKDALDIGIKEWALMKEEGIRIYPSDKYNELSFAFIG